MDPRQPPWHQDPTYIPHQSDYASLLDTELPHQHALTNPPPSRPPSHSNPLPSFPNAQLPTAVVEPHAETWVQFLNTRPHHYPHAATAPPLPCDTHLTDRKRRLTSTDHQDSSSRRPSRPFISPHSSSLRHQPPPPPRLSHASSAGMQNNRSTPNRNISPGSSHNNPIDLTSPGPPPNRPLAGPRNPHGTMNSNIPHSGIVLPRWQPDSEATVCPVCTATFTFLNRKHHCRKCGRVVCSACSPHRITLPRQFIVRPPSIPDVSSAAFPTTSDIEWSGGDEVRVCNPCVPDPNLSPPFASPPFGSVHQNPNQDMYAQRYTYPSQPNATAPQPFASGWMGPSGRIYEFPGRQSSHSGHRPSRSATGVPSAPPFNYPSSSLSPPFLRQGGVNVPSNPQFRGYRQPATQPLPHGLDGALPQDLHSFFSGSQPSGSSTSLAAPPRPQVAEEDECPVCGEELPPKKPDGGTADREAHIESCVQAHMYSSSAPPAATGLARPSGPQSAAGPSSQVPSDDQNRVRPRRMTGGRMLVYKATEKDCAGEDGVAQECVICLEEFETADEMGRLECLCKFHRKCIRDWWETKGQGTCPTHQLHDT